MRTFLALALFASVANAVTQAQPAGAKTPSSAAIEAALQSEVQTKPFAGPMKFREFLEQLGKLLGKSKGNTVTFAVDDEAFRAENSEAPDVYDVEVRVRTQSEKTTALGLLREALKGLPGKAALLIRAGKVEIVPFERTSKEYMLNQTFNADFKDRPLAAALEDLSELTSVSIVIDARAKAKAQTPVTARFRGDVALQDAVRMLTDMAELKVVYLVTGNYITTPEHALVMQKELKQLYEGQNPMPGPISPPSAGMVGMTGGGPPPSPEQPQPQSPLAPPLPPRMRQKEGAFLKSPWCRPSVIAQLGAPRFVEVPRLEAEGTRGGKPPSTSDHA